MSMVNSNIVCSQYVLQKTNQNNNSDVYEVYKCYFLVFIKIQNACLEGLWES